MSLRTELSPSKKIPALPLVRSLALALTFTSPVWVPLAAPAQTSVVPPASPASPSVPAPQPPPGPAQVTSAQSTGAVSMRGTISDPDDELIPGATVTLAPNSGKTYSTTSGSDGTYTLKGVPSGTYNVTVTMPGFATFVRPGVRISATALTLNAKMAIQSTDQVVNVDATSAMVSVDPDSNPSQTVLTGKDLDALSDDPDELSAELSALAGPSSGPNGGQIYIDGFTGGQLPPKSSIREIRINQNPFSAQYDRVGFGRVEIFTKPGTDKFHGNVQLQGQDKAFNTGSVFIAPTTFQPDYHTIFGNGTVTGPINKRASFTASGSYRDIQDNLVVNPPGVFATSQTSGTICNPGQAGCSLYQIATGNGYNTVQFEPQTRWDVSGKLDLQVTEKNTLSTRVQYEHNSAQNQGVGGLDLFSTGDNTLSTEFTIQATDTQILSPKVINETRFEYQRPTSDATPFSTAPTVSVQGSFVSGGSNSGTSNDTQTHIEVQNYTSIALAKNFIRLGGRLRTTSDNNTTTAGSNGEFVYNSLSNYQAGIASTYSFSNVINATVQARSTDVGLYAEDDWKIKPNWTFSYGLRFETQNYINDKADFAPRLSTAYGITKKTVLRGGFGIFYDRFNLANQLAIYRNNGLNEQQLLLTSSSNSTPIPTSCTITTFAACPKSASATVRSTTDSVAPNLHAPYSMQFNIGVDQQAGRFATVSVNYQHIRGVHQFVDTISNYINPTATNNLVYQYQSEGEFNQNQVVTNINVRGIKNVTLFGYYVLNFAKSDTSGVNSFNTIPNNIKADYGRASFDTRNRAFIGGNINLPHLIALAPLIVANSGTPYTITSGTDAFGTAQYNSRAVIASPGQQPTTGQIVKTLPGCGTFATPNLNGALPVLGVNYNPAPINSCTGPANFTTNLRVTKTIGFGKPRVADNSQPDRPRGQGGPPSGGSHSSSRSSGGGGFGGPGGGFGNSGKRYNLGFGVQVSNLFNIADRAVPVGNITSPSFGTSTSLSGGIFTTNSAIRRIYLQSSFTF